MALYRVTDGQFGLGEVLYTEAVVRVFGFKIVAKTHNRNKIL